MRLYPDMHACPSAYMTGAFVWKAMQEAATLDNLSVLQ